MQAVVNTFSRHDKYQLETVFTYPFRPEDKRTEYYIDTYFFVPENLGINRQSYSNEVFYNNAQRYLRFKTPRFGLKGILVKDDSPLKRLEQMIKALAADGSAANVKEYGDSLKIFCSIMKSAIRDENQLLESVLKHKKFDLALASYQRKLDEILRRFRKLSALLATPHVTERERLLFRYADEFLSLNANKYRGALWQKIDAAGELPHTKKSKEILYREMADEIDYRRRMKYPTIQQPDGDNEDFLYRESTLKKLMASVLFLKASCRKDGVLLENIMFCIAAGIAMAFVTSIAFFWRGMLFNDFSIWFFMVWVIAYMGKDRIKELLRAYFQVKIKRFVYDYKTVIFNELDEEMGYCKESMDFVAEHRIDPWVRKLRSRSLLSDLENTGYPEEIILYRKLVSLNNPADKKLLKDFEVAGIVDIMRFDVRKFLEKMDNPTKEIYIPDKPPVIRPMKAKRVYHVNVIIKYSMAGEKDLYRRYRLILSRNGICRIIHEDNAEGEVRQPSAVFGPLI